MRSLLLILTVCAGSTFADTRPATQPTDGRRAAEQIVAKLDNSRVTEWYFARAHPAQGEAVGKLELFYFGTYHINWDDGAAVEGSRTAITPAEMASALIEALDDPKKFVVAHLALVGLLGDWEYRHAPPEGPTVGVGRLTEGNHGSAIFTIDGLRVELVPYWEGAYGSDGADQLPFACTAKIDPAQCKAISKQWHERLPRFLRQMDELASDRQTARH